MDDLSLSFLAMLFTCSVVLVVGGLAGRAFGNFMSDYLARRFPEHVRRLEEQRARQAHHAAE